MESPIILRPDTSDISMLKNSMEHLESMSHRFDRIYPSHGRRPVSPSILKQIKQAVELLLSGAKGDEFTADVPDGQVFAGQLYKFGKCTLFMLNLERSKLYD